MIAGLHLPLKRMAAAASLFLLAACQTDEAATGPASSQAFQGHRVQAYIDGFNALCFAPGLSVDTAAEIAEQRDIGVTAPTRYLRRGSEKFEITARVADTPVTDRAQVFETYECETVFRGRWADYAAPAILAELRAAGFQTVAGPVRMERDGAVRHEVALRRGADRFILQVAHSGPGSRTTRGRMAFVRISGTGLRLEAQIGGRD